MNIKVRIIQRVIKDNLENKFLDTYTPNLTFTNKAFLQYFINTLVIVNLHATLKDSKWQM